MRYVFAATLLGLVMPSLVMPSAVPTASAAPPATIVDPPTTLSMQDEIVPGTYRAAYVCMARSEKEAKLTTVFCDLTDASGEDPIHDAGQLSGPIAVTGNVVGGIIAPAMVCARATAVFEVDGKAVTVSDGPECIDIPPG